MLNKHTHYFGECKLTMWNEDTPYYLENVN